jgi:26S proteasome regulatory subunit N4
MGNNLDTVGQKTAEAQLKEIFADELYNPSFHVTSASESPTPALSSTLSPQKDVFSQRVQAANNQYLNAWDSEVPVNVLAK